MLIWSIVFAICVAVEIAIPALVSVWFAGAALLMIPLSIFINDTLIEVLIFLVLSLIFLLTLRRICRKFISPKDSLRKEEVIIDKILQDDADKSKGLYFYELKYKGGIWTGQGEKEHKPGDKAYIKSFEGNKIIIE